jgi:hypothetical protein
MHHMSKPTVAGAGGSSSGENPTVHSKGETYHGKPHSPSKVAGPGDVSPKFGHERHAPSSSHKAGHGTVHHYEPGHPAMGGLHHGAKAKHPSHDVKQAAYENEHGLHGRGPMDVK